MRKIFYSAIISSLLVAGIAHAESGTGNSRKMMIEGNDAPTTTMMHFDNDIMRRAPGMMGSGTPRMGSGTPPMQRDNHVVFSSSSMPMIGSGTPMCRKFARALSVGAKGDDVKDLQEMLHERGYLSASSTGYFGMVTKAAVAKFQKDGGLNPSGFFGDLSRKHHEKRCDEGMGRDDDRGMGSTTPPMMGGDDHKWNGSSTMPVPCMTSASASGCEHSRAFHPMMGTGTPQSLCTTKFDPLTGKHCKKDSDDDHFWSTSTPPVMLPPATTTATTTTI